jgi:predicted signal transduction protein with EAL and GGDEF domain
VLRPTRAIIGHVRTVARAEVACDGGYVGRVHFLVRLYALWVLETWQVDVRVAVDAARQSELTLDRLERL